jgi:glutathione synthase/RimK-type ligase-like ATP-grasp enzyme
MSHGAIRLVDGNAAYAVIRLANQQLDSREFSSVWFRRVANSPLPKELSPDDKEYVNDECSAFLTGFFDLISAHWVNDRAAERVASNKIHQLRVARNMGLRCPKTLVTNDPEEVRAFAGTVGGQLLFKPLAGFSPRGADFSRELASFPEVKSRYEIDVLKQRSHEEIVFSQLLTDEKLASLAALEICPAIFQEYVEKRFEVRVTVVGQDMFACEIHSQNDHATKIDFRRMVLLESIDQVEHREHRLDSDVAHKLDSLMKSLGLQFGCIDLILTPEGEYVFLEVNPSGQWLWIEQLIGSPISNTLAGLLSRRRE